VIAKNNMNFLVRLIKSLFIGLGAILALFFTYYLIVGNMPNGISLDVIRMAGFGLAMWCYFARPKKRDSPLNIDSDRK
jgi:hypothetical protein